MALLDTVNEIRDSRERFQRRSQGQHRRRLVDEGMSPMQADMAATPAPKVNMRRAMAALNQTFKETRQAQLQNRDRQMRMMQAMAQPEQPQADQPPAEQQQAQPQQAPQGMMGGGMMPQGQPGGMMGGQPSPFGGGLLG